ncbi:hypothetical protein U0070_012204, partial [Myodes glareolus]
IHEKSIQTENGEWLTLREFEISGNRERSKKWRQSIRCDGYVLEDLIKVFWGTGDPGCVAMTTEYMNGQLRTLLAAPLQFFTQQRKEDFPDLPEHMRINKIKNRLN